MVDGKPGLFAANAFGPGWDAATIRRPVLDLLEARVQFDGPERSIHVRAEHAGRIYLDLADEGLRAVEIGSGAWR
jgi:hypothetical protein